MMTLTYVHIARSHAIRRHAISRTYSGALSSCLRCSSSTPPLSHFGNHRHPTTSSVYSGLSLCIGIHAHCVLPWTVQTVGAHRACYDATVLIFCSSFVLANLAGFIFGDVRRYFLCCCDSFRPTVVCGHHLFVFRDLHSTARRNCVTWNVVFQFPIVNMSGGEIFLATPRRGESQFEPS